MNETVETAGRMAAPWWRRRQMIEPALLVVPFVLLYFPVLRHLRQVWEVSPEYSHGYLIPVIAGFIVWGKRDKLKKIKPKGEVLGLLIVIACLLLYLFTILIDTWTVRAHSMLGVLFGILLYLWGREAVKELLFPFAFLFFMVPLFTFLMSGINFRLQYFSTVFSVQLVSWLGIPVFREGAIIHLPNADLQIVEACSGIRSLFALLAIGALYAHFFHGGLLVRIFLFLTAIPIALVANGLRVTFLCLMAYRFGIDATIASVFDAKLTVEGFVHTASGFAVFLLEFICLYLVGRGVLLSRTLLTRRSS